MRKYAARTDANHKQIVKAFRDMGFSVVDTSRVGNGFPDLIVGIHGRNGLVEVKDGEKSPSNRKLTDDQERFFDQWRGQSSIIESVDEAIAFAERFISNRR